MRATTDAPPPEERRKNPYDSITNWKFKISYFDGSMKGCDKTTYESITYKSRSTCAFVFRNALMKHEENMQDVIRAYMYPLE